MAEQNRNFGLLMATAFFTLALIRFVWNGEIIWPLAGSGLLFLAAAFLVPSWLAPLRRVWMKLAAVLGFVNSRILLTVVFVCLITPVALLLRALRKRPIELDSKHTAGSYWRARRSEEFMAVRMERQF